MRTLSFDFCGHEGQRKAERGVIKVRTMVLLVFLTITIFTPCVVIGFAYLSDRLGRPIKSRPILRDEEDLPFVYVVQKDGSVPRQHVRVGYRAET